MSACKGGDVLARGATSCQFPTPGGNVSQDHWDKIFGRDSGPAGRIAEIVKKTRKKKTKK